MPRRDSPSFLPDGSYGLHAAGRERHLPPRTYHARLRRSCGIGTLKLEQNRGSPRLQCLCLVFITRRKIRYLYRIVQVMIGCLWYLTNDCINNYYDYCINNNMIITKIERLHSFMYEMKSSECIHSVVLYRVIESFRLSYH